MKMTLDFYNYNIALKILLSWAGCKMTLRVIRVNVTLMWVSHSVFTLVNGDDVIDVMWQVKTFSDLMFVFVLPFHIWLPLFFHLFHCKMLLSTMINLCCLHTRCLSLRNSVRNVLQSMKSWIKKWKLKCPII